MSNILVEKDQIWSHKERQTKYKVLAVGVLESNLEKSVTYQSLDNGAIWTRVYHEFVDGRFEYLEKQIEKKPFEFLYYLTNHTKANATNLNILVYLYLNGKSTSKQLADGLDMQDSNVSKALKSLFNSGYISRSNINNKSYEYFINEYNEVITNALEFVY